jgi:hypothetical protein
MAEIELPDPFEIVEPHMTVGSLRALLVELPDDAMVLVTGYEGDMTVAVAPEKVEVSPVPTDEDAWYNGEWRRAEADGEANSSVAVYIGGRRHSA